MATPAKQENSTPQGEGWKIPTRRVKNCAFYPFGACKRGDQCRYSHVLNDGSPANPVRRQSLGKPVQLPPNAVWEPPKVLQKGAANATTGGNSISFNKDSSVLEPKMNRSLSYPLNWVDAPEFVPKMTYASVVKLNPSNENPWHKPVEVTKLCADFVFGACHLDGTCPDEHGDKCDICELNILKRNDESQRKEHIEACEESMKRDSELSSKIERRVDHTCDLCLETVIGKETRSEHRFAIVDNCRHVFCITCIRRMITMEDSDDLDDVPDLIMPRWCPICGSPANFIFCIIPEEKGKLFADYLDALSRTPCKFFERFAKKCPFGRKCLCLHSLPDGATIEKKPKSERLQQEQTGELDGMDEVALSKIEKKPKSERQERTGEVDGMDNVTLSAYLESRGDTVLRTWIRGYSDTENSGRVVVCKTVEHRLYVPEGE